MQLRNMGYLFVVYLTRIFIFAIFVMSLILGYLILYPKPNKTVVYNSNTSQARYVATLDSPGMNIRFLSNWVKDFVATLYTFNMNNSEQVIDSLQAKLLHPSSFKQQFLDSDLVKSVNKEGLDVSSIVDGSLVSFSGNFFAVRDGEWRITVPLRRSESGLGVSNKANGKIIPVTVIIKRVPAIEAPLSGVKILQVNDNSQDNV
jgi:hypothetical protein